MNKFFFKKNLPLFKKGDSGDIDFRPETKINSFFLLYGFIFFIFVCFLVIVLRLFQLTVVKGSYYRQLADENRIKEIIIEPKRGRIIDRKGFVMAENKQADVNQQEDRLLSPRFYQAPQSAAHLIGYRQLADKKDLQEDHCLNKLKLGDKVGKKGVEKIYDCKLRGEAGKKLIEVDARGKFLKTLTILLPVDGQTIQLAVDLDLQKKAYELIKNQKAAVIGMKPKTGEVLLFVSSPSFDPEDFEKGKQEASYYIENKDKPLFSRAAEGVYPPGSIFKLVIAAGALEEKKITADSKFEDTGTIKAGSLIFGNWYFLQYGKTEGMVNVVKAIQRSNDTFFYQVGAKLGLDKINIWAERFGYGRPTGIGFEEAEGLVPSAFWKKETLKENWYTGDTYNLSIGQGYLLVTPLQVALATSVFANNGYLCRPELLKAQNLKLKAQNCQKLPISEKNLKLIQEGMKKACLPGGTGWPLFEFKIQTACKTGTAESHAESKIPHAWFTVYAPTEAPEIVLTILIEEGGQGSDVAGPIAKEILKSYFERNE